MSVRCEHHQVHTGCSESLAFARAALLQLQQREHAPAHLRLQLVVNADVTRQPRKRQRFVTRVPEQQALTPNSNIAFTRSTYRRRSLCLSATAGPRSSGSFPSSSRCSCPPASPAGGRRPGRPGAPSRSSGGDQHGSEVRRVAAVQDLPAGQREHAARSVECHHAVSKNRGLMLRLAPDPVEIADRSMARSTARREPLASESASRPIVGMPRPAWISTGSRRSCASARLPRAPSTAQPFRAGCSFLPRAPFHAAASLAGPVAVRVDPTERHKPPGLSLALFQHAVVRDG